MRVAVVHDWLSESGGAEKVTRELVDLFRADVFALVDFLSDDDRSIILNGRHARTTFIQHLPFARRNFRWYLPLFPRAMRGLDLRSYDLVISSSYAFAKGVRIRPGQKHICYIHTPMRWAWVNEEGYLLDHGLHAWKARIVKRVLRRLRDWDLATNTGIDRFIANSRNVADRVRQIYRRDADVVIPPVDIDTFRLHTGKREGFLVVSRLVPYKRIDRIIEAFKGLPEHELTIAGDGPEASRLRELAPANVRFTGHVSTARIVELMQRASALICAAHEDLGLTVLEAQGCGTPVLGLRAGGYLETVDVAHGGRFFESDEPAAIRRAVLDHVRSAARISHEALSEGMTRYSREHFRAHMAAIAQTVMADA